MTSTGKAGEPAGTPQSSPEPEPENGVWKRLIKATATNGRLALAAWLFVLAMWVASFGLAWWLWLELLPELWKDVGRPADVLGFLEVAGMVVGLFLLVLIPLVVWVFVYDATDDLVAVSVGDQDAYAEARKDLREADDALRRFETDDDAGLLPLLRYSRAQLQAYYEMGLGQTRRAFLNATLAMWLGFLLIVAGIALYIVPASKLPLPRPPEDAKWLIFASAAILEIVSALFLWVYRSTIGQLTFYYRLQMQSHTAIMCFRIATTMKEPADDEAKRVVIDKLLTATLEPERPTAPNAKGLAALVQSAPVR